MIFLQGILALLYTGIIAVLIWARFRYFNVDTKSAKKTSYFYDPIAALHICTTFYLFIVSDQVNLSRGLLAMVLYTAGIIVFIKTVSEARFRSYAFSSKIEQLITTGTYRIVRHPLYLSYALIWIGSSVVFNSILLWITLAYLLVFYFISATKEEETIATTKYSGEYELYRQNVGMFLPRIRGWKS